MMIYIFLAIFTGIIFAISRSINSRLGMVYGPIKGSFWNHLVGFLFLASLLFLSDFKSQFSNINHISVYTYLGGFFGALFVSINSYVFPRIGAVKTIMLVVGAQIVSSVIIDHKTYSLTHMMMQFFGIAIILLGVYLAKSSGKNKSDEIIETLLNDRSHHIEFNGHLTNHNKHAVVALKNLGATPEQIKSFYDNYAKMTPYGYSLEPPKISKHVITKNNWQTYLGMRTSYSSYYEFFDQEEKKLGMVELLKSYVPILLPGWAGSLMHGTIHLGFALDVNNRCMILEALAYMAFSYVSCHPERMISTNNDNVSHETILDSLFYIADTLENDPQFNHWVETLIVESDSEIAKNIHPELARSGLQYRIAKLLANGHPLIYAKPAWIQNKDTSILWKELHYVITLLYMEKPGDFLILHLVTSLHSMEKIADYISIEQQKMVIECFWVGILCILFSRGEFPKRKILENLHSKYKVTKDINNILDEGENWKTIIKKAMMEKEEHNPKIVYVLQRMWKLSGYQSIFRIAANYFTTTPELPKSFEIPPTE